MEKFAVPQQRQQSAPAPQAEHNKETDLTRIAAGYRYRDQKNLTMKCPEGEQHATELFRSAPPTLRLYWRCQVCKSNNARFPQKMIGADNELEADGMKTIDPSRTGESKSVVTGNGLQWEQLFADCGRIAGKLAVLDELDGAVKRLIDRVDELDRELKRARKAPDTGSSNDVPAAEGVHAASV